MTYFNTQCHPVYLQVFVAIRFLVWSLTLPGIELTIKTDFAIHLIALMIF